MSYLLINKTHLTEINTEQDDDKTYELMTYTWTDDVHELMTYMN